jgi:hypothetical protein
MTEIMSTNTRIWAQTDAYERISGLCLQTHKRIHVLVLTDIRVVTRGSTVLTYLLTANKLSLGGSIPYTSTDETNKNKYTS